MPYLRNYTKLTFGGTSAEAQEIWSCGLSLSGHLLFTPDGGSPIEIDDYENWYNWALVSQGAIGAVVTAMVDDSTNRIPAGFVMEYMKLAYVGTDGLQLGEPVVWLTNTPGGGATSYVPQVSTVITLDSGKWRDPGKYSRYYLPAAAPGSGNYKLTSLMTQAIATAQGNFIGALNDAVVAPYENVPAGGDYVYDAQVSAVSSAGTGQDNTIQTVRVGDIYDTQRRRRNALTETYSTAEVP